MIGCEVFNRKFRRTSRNDGLYESIPKRQASFTICNIAGGKLFSLLMVLLTSPKQLAPRDFCVGGEKLRRQRLLVSRLYNLIVFHGGDSKAW